jgi:hypothetical protein
MGQSAPHDREVCREDRHRRDQFESETIEGRRAGWLLETASSLPSPLPVLRVRSMKRKGYYSPPLQRDLVTRLYHTARDLRMPMTVLNDRIVQEALDRMETACFTQSRNKPQAMAA